MDGRELERKVVVLTVAFDGISGGKRGWFPSNLTVTPNDSGDVANFTTSLSSNASLISNTSADSTILYPTTSMAIPLLAKDGKIARSTSSNENTAAIDISMTQENSSSNIQTPTSLSSSYSHIQCSSSPRCSSPVLIASLKKEKSPKFRRMQQSHTIITPLEQLDRPCDNQNSYFPTTPVGLATVLVQQSPLAHSLTTFNLEMNSNLSAAIQAAKVPSESTELDELKGLKEALKLVMNTKNTKIALSATAPSPPTTFNHTKGLKQSAIVGNARGEPVFGISVDAEGQNKLRSNESDLGVKFATPSPPPYSITTPSPSFVLSDSPMDNDCVAENNVQHAASDLACPTNESVSARDLIGVVSLLEKRVEELTVYSTSHCDSPRCRVLDGRENTMAVLSLTKLLVDDSMKLFQLLEIHELPHLRISLSQAFARLVDAATDFSSNLTDLLGHLHTVSILLNILRRRLPSLNQSRVLRGGKHSILKEACGPAAVNSNLRLSLDLPRGKKPLFPHKPPQNATSLRSLSSALSIASFQFSSQSSSGSKDLHVVKETVKGGTVKALTRYSLQNLASEFTRAFITTYSTFLDYAQLLDLLVEETNGPWMIEQIGMDFSASQSPIMRCQSCHDSRHTIHAHPRPCLSSPSRPTSSFSVTTTATTDQRHHSHTLLPSNSASLSVSPFFLGNTSGPRSFPFSVSHSAMDEAPSDSSAHSLLPEQLHHSLILKKGFSHQQNVRHSTPSIMPSHHSTCPSSLTLLVWDVVEVARNLTLIDHSLLSRINSHECLDKYWSTHEHSNIRSMIRFANEINNWVMETILLESDARRRTTTVKHFIMIAEECHSMCNFNSSMSIMAALNSAPVFRLTRTWDALSTRTLDVFTKLQLLFSPSQNFTNYRKVLNCICGPCVPFLGLYLTDLTFVSDGNANFLSSHPKFINFDKRMRMATIIQSLLAHKTPSYTFPPTSFSFKPRMERTNDDFYQLSIKLEPREGEDEKLARMLRESGFL